MWNKKTTCLAVLLGLALQVPVAHADSLTDQAKVLLDAGKASQAYALLEPQESARAGEVGYDLLLGLAALDVAQNTRAVFALERVLAMEPNNARARTEIARAYLALGEASRARNELETVQKQGVPADVSVTLERYLAATRQVTDQEKTTMNGYVELTVGHDSNVNLGPRRDSVLIPGPVFPVLVDLSNDSKANADTFGQLGAGFNLRAPVASGVAVLAGVSGFGRFNGDKSQFDVGNADANLGVVFTSGKNVYTLMGQVNSLSVDQQNYRTAGGLTAQWQHNLDARNQFSVYGQYSDIHYATQGVRDADRWVVGGAFAHLWRDGALGYVSPYLLKEKPQTSGMEHLGFDGYGLRLGARANMNEKTILFGNVSYENRRHNGIDSSFLTTRKDTQYGLLFGASYAFAKDWSLTPQLSFTVNESNIELNDYRRDMVSVTVRREF